MPKIVVDKTRCKGCERCVEACPQSVIAMSKQLNEKGYFYAVPFDQPRCLGCMLCAINCPDIAIEVFVHGTQYQFIEY
ncbi:MAG: 4Fe-4S dicluster domain-containing protein [Phycisphaerales bacterium]|nr:MAG: 4Fe-4S dicluster domain-containing protein [Phycisphaerales bacterium]